MMIHKTALIDPRAEIERGVSIGPYSVIGPSVKIGGDTKIASHVVIEGEAQIGSRCQIFPFAAIGGIPQDLKFKREKTRLIIGDDNIIREFVTIHRGTKGGEGVTRIGSKNLLMAYCHVAHDCMIGNNVILANQATLAGHIEIEDFAIIGGLVAIHQFVKIGSYSLIGGASAVTKDVPPYMLAVGNRAKLYGLNSVGLRRHNFSENSLSELKRAYKTLFRSGLTLNKALERIASEIKGSPEVNHLIEFIKDSKRGITR